MLPQKRVVVLSALPEIDREHELSPIHIQGEGPKVGIGLFGAGLVALLIWMTVKG